MLADVLLQKCVYGIEASLIVNNVHGSCKKKIFENNNTLSISLWVEGGGFTHWSALIASNSQNMKTALVPVIFAR